MFRLVTRIVLLLSLVNLSGLGATASALMHVGAVEACCEVREEQDLGPGHGQEGEQDHEPAPGLDRVEPCYAPGCLCIFCAPDDLTTQPSPGLPPDLSGSAPGAPAHIHSSDFVSSIEYPPEGA